jgi:hypothetical protein
VWSAVEGLEPVDFGTPLGAKQRGAIAWRMHSNYGERLHDADLRRFDWTKAQQLRGSALKLWMVFTSTRVPYRSVLDSRDGLETVEIPLTLDHCNALGVYNSNDAGRRRTLNEAGERVCAVDRSFQSFEAHGGRGQDSFLRVVRKPPLTSPLARPFDGAPQELRLLVA